MLLQNDRRAGILVAVDPTKAPLVRSMLVRSGAPFVFYNVSANPEPSASQGAAVVLADLDWLGQPRGAQAIMALQARGIPLALVVDSLRDNHSQLLVALDLGPIDIVVLPVDTDREISNSARSGRWWGLQVARELSVELNRLPADLGLNVILSLCGVLSLETAADMDHGQCRSHRSVCRLLKLAGLRAPYVITRASRIAVMMSHVSRPKDIRNATESSSFRTPRTAMFTVKRYLGLPAQTALRQLSSQEIAARLANAMRLPADPVERHHAELYACSHDQVQVAHHA